MELSEYKDESIPLEITIEDVLPLLNSMNADDIKFGIALVRSHNINIEKLKIKLKPLSYIQWEGNGDSKFCESKWCETAKKHAGDLYRCLNWSRSGREIIYLTHESEILY